VASKLSELESRDFAVSCMHGDLDQHERNVVMREFRSSSSRVLISTDLLARGIDVQQVSLVMNYDTVFPRTVRTTFIASAVQAVLEEREWLLTLSPTVMFVTFVILKTFMLRKSWNYPRTFASYCKQEL
jgi:hypothetical protein